MVAQPGPAILIKDKSDPLVEAACFAQWTFIDIMSVGLSPVALECNEAWKPLLAKAADRFGYCWEWVPDENQPATDDPYWKSHYWQSRQGHAVLRKV